MAGRSFGPEPQIKQTVGKFLDKIQTGFQKQHFSKPKE